MIADKYAVLPIYSSSGAAYGAAKMWLDTTRWLLDNDQYAQAPPGTLARRVDGYISAPGNRGERNASIQRAQITRYVRRRGWRLASIVEETARSGSPRPDLLAVLQRVEAGDSDGVVVAGLDDMGSSLHDALAAIERVEAAGATFVSVRDELDLSTPSGRRTLRLLFALAEWR